MKHKMVKVPFDIELAKKITNGEVDGRIVTREGGSARVVCWDVNDRDDYVLALLSNDNREYPVNFLPNGRLVKDEEKQSDLMIELPEYLTFKEGDLIAYENGDLVLFKAHIFNRKCYQQYAVLSNSGLEIGTSACMVYDGTQLANEEKRQVFINALKSSEHPMAKGYLKRFFNIKQRKEYEFKPFDKVLVRDANDGCWHADIFSHKNKDRGRYYCTGYEWRQCIPYNEQTAHLLGTTENWEE